MRYLIALLWFIIFAKKFFFWVYLWQLKEYHIGRFIDHFQTHKGKKLIFNYLTLIKILLLLSAIFAAKQGFEEIKFNLVNFITLVLFAEALFALKSFWQKSFKRPVLTQKTAVILNTGFSFAVLLIFFLFLLEFKLTKFTATLLLLDILIPIGLSLLVLAFQPLAVILRNRILKQAKLKRAVFKNLLVIGITGSYGKTSTKEFLTAILSEKFNGSTGSPQRVLKTREHQNSEVGISECILDELTPEHRIFIVEMGAYNRGGIKLLCDIAKPKIGMITGINEQHMATFGSLENIIKTKYELIESLPQDGVAFFNGKNKYCRELCQKTGIKKYLYGENAGLGMENFEGAKAVAKELGMTDEEIERASRKIENKFPGIKFKEGVNGLKIIDATFSANPDSVITHLEYLKTLPGKKMIIMPCLIELGEASAEVHRRIGAKISEVCDLAIITTKDHLKEIREGIAFVEVNPQQERGLTSTKSTEIIFLEDPNKIFEKIQTICKEGDIILLESRVPSELLNLLFKN